jgi:hypothetical protein
MMRSNQVLTTISPSQVLLEVDSKFTAQLCALLNRDIVEPITRELELNAQVKTAIEEMKQGISAGGDKLDSILSRRRQLLASAVCALVGHQSNYHARLGAQYAPLQAHVQANKTALSSIQSQGPARSSTPDRAEHAESRPAAPPAEVRRPEPEPKPQESASPSKPAPAPVKQQEADLLSFGSSTPTASQASAAAKSVEADLLGFTSTSEKPSTPAPPSNAQGDLLSGLGGPSASAPQPKQPQPEADLLGGLFGPSVSTPTKAQQPKPQPQGDLFSDFTPTTASNKSSAANNDPFGDWMGGSGAAKPQAKPQQQDNFLNMFDPMAGSGGGARPPQNSSVPRVNGDDDGNDSPGGTVPVARRKPALNSFAGTGTDREALKQQFNDHVQKKVRS